MKPFIHDDFLLQTDAARDLYHNFAKNEPIYDYHCHLPHKQILENKSFADLAEIWLGGDHYKWRAMRSNGVDERFCTGNASPREKFDAWCATVPHTLRNPLYHWSHLELTRYFGIPDIINPASADKIWQEANAKLAGMRVHDILAANKVAAICTTDDPADPLEFHEQINRSGIKTRVYPTFRPDKAFLVDNPAAYGAWLEKLSGVTGSPVKSFDDFLDALEKRHAAFHAVGGRLSDHGMESCYADPCTAAEAKAIFDAARAGRAANAADYAKFASFLMIQLGRWDAKRGWTKQLHLGALRNNNTRLLTKLGADTGFDSIGDFPQARALSTYLNALDTTGELPRTVLYNLNPADNYAFATMIGNFQDGSVPGKMQFGSGWWFLDQKEAMEWQINALSNLGLLSRFVGMLTDSRSFLSYPRHEYFRRTLCNLLGHDMERGEIPHDRALVGGMVKNICFANARDYFRLELDPSFAK
ncbi:glucuronate isomerase [Oleiharenicola lentus]|jgi:glucuronate isomerase|uniref:Uronate isomerase n=1 Tax=Oleiharenicola lentus TaxID=2508720 RepID=A0A4Q1C7S7_9BACT|nr:glucuronate isomerase [Oleiharenicola lentus]RXK54861.1 glucuronate isomerase [Oleiharenicola lentus]